MFRLPGTKPMPSSSPFGSATLTSSTRPPDRFVWIGERYPRMVLLPWPVAVTSTCSTGEADALFGSVQAVV